MKISIIALGRLGQTVFNLIENKHNVFGSYHSHKKEIENEVQFDFHSKSVPAELNNADVLLLNITPSTIKTIDSFKKFCKSVKFKKLIFISSTSVYGNQGIVDESSIPIPNTQSGILLNDCENFIQNTIDDFTIIRPAGIIYQNSHPAKYLSGRDFSVGKNEKVNLIEIVDLANIVVKSISCGHKIINAVNKNHPLKYDYYQNYCSRNQLEQPNFIVSEFTDYKVVNTKYSEFYITKDLP